jgi:hypothetical protein
MDNPSHDDNAARSRDDGPRQRFGGVTRLPLGEKCIAEDDHGVQRYTFVHGKVITPRSADSHPREALWDITVNGRRRISTLANALGPYAEWEVIEGERISHDGRI